MSCTVSFTKASLRRAADVAREKGFAVVIRPDGTLVLEKREYSHSEGRCKNHAAVIDDTFDAVAVAIMDYIVAEHPDRWSGTATELLAALNARVSDGVRKSKLWPLSAQGLGNRIDRVAPLLRNKGFTVERRHSGQRFIIIAPPRTAEVADAESRRT